MAAGTLAIVGNPNSGKTALFNELTGLKQRTGNFSGVTVEHKLAKVEIDDQMIDLVDLPGTYSLYPLTADEHVVTRMLLDKTTEISADAVLFIADPIHLERHLLLYTQIRDLGYPILLALSMADVTRDKGIQIDRALLEKRLGHRVVLFSSRTHEGIEELKASMADILKNGSTHKRLYDLSSKESALIKDWPKVHRTDYGQLVGMHHSAELGIYDEALTSEIDKRIADIEFDHLGSQVEETMQRFEKIDQLINGVVAGQKDQTSARSLKADRVLTNAILGPIIFLFILFLIFQAIFTVAEVPMNWIELIFSTSSSWLSSIIPDGVFNSLITDGILPGLAGVLVFIPQIAILFFLLGLLEESGYLSRAVFLFDKFFRRLGMNGRSLIAMVSASACAIPAIMSARGIKNNRERLVTILLSPFISCSARTPVYVVLVGFVVSSEKVWGAISLQGLAFMGFYLVGIFAVILIALILKLIYPSTEPSYLMLELPEYKWPSLKDIGLFTWMKVKSFIVEAGKIIFVVSLILWFLASHGPSSRYNTVKEEVAAASTEQSLTQDDIESLESAKLLEYSYAGRLGKLMEPLITPLGYDWKIGIALVTSFAAREVFVSTMATIYAIGSEDDTDTIVSRMDAEINPVTGQKVYTQATALSLIVFYIFAMQCMSTMAVVRKETGSWKWPILQFVFMGALAYVSAFAVYQWLA